MKELLDDEEHMDTLFLVHPYVTATAVGKNLRAAEAASKSVSNNKQQPRQKNASNLIPSIPSPAPPPP